MTFFVTGVNYKTAPVELRERLAVGPSQLVSCAQLIRQNWRLEEIVLLSTCNRTEIYGVTPRMTDDMDLLFQSVCSDLTEIRAHIYVRKDFEALHHLFRVAAGLDSMLLGETEITGQVKNAYSIAHGARLTGGVLNRAFQSALRTAKEIRTETGIGRGTTSVGSVTAELAERIFLYDLGDQTVMIIGAGQMGEACVRHLAKRGARSILVCNRSPERAVELANQFRGQAVEFERSIAAIAKADIVIVSTTSPEPLLHRIDINRLMARRRHRPLFLVDLSVPRNIEDTVQCVDNVFLYDIDDLEAIVRENVRSREQELTLCHEIIDARVAGLMQKFRSEEKRLQDFGRQLECALSSCGVGFLGS